MRRGLPSGVLRRGLGGLAVALALTGCAGAAPVGTVGEPVSGAVTPGPDIAPDVQTSGPVEQSAGLPTDWPAGLILPDGATVTWSTTDDTGMSVLFDAPQDLPALRSWFDGVVTGLGYARKTDDSFVGMLSTSWTDGAVTISVTATPVDDRTSGVLLVQPDR